MSSHQHSAHGILGHDLPVFAVDGFMVMNMWIDHQQAGVDGDGGVCFIRSSIGTGHPCLPPGMVCF